MGSEDEYTIDSLILTFAAHADEVEVRLQKAFKEHGDDPFNIAKALHVMCKAIKDLQSRK